MTSLATYHPLTDPSPPRAGAPEAPVVYRSKAHPILFSDFGFRYFFCGFSGDVLVLLEETETGLCYPFGLMNSWNGG